jgi:uncharacterized membrane protein HdeD (DUF308 family)
MQQEMSRNWWALAIRGIAAILFGIVVILWPSLALNALILVFGAYALVDGVFAIATGIRRREANPRWWAVVLEGIISILAGIAALLLPTEMVAVTFVTILAVWAIITGVLEVLAAIQLRKEIEGEWFLALTGVLSILFGILAFLFPGPAILTVLWMISGYAIVFGILMLVLAFQLRGMREPPVDRPNQSPA